MHGMRVSVHIDPSSADGNSRTVNRRIIALALPTFGQLIAEPTFVLIDTAIVGHIGDTALAGLSIGSTIILTAVGLCVFLAYSTTAQVAHLLGAGHRREGLQAGIDGLWLALGIGIVLSLGLFAGAEPLCQALGGKGAVLDQAVAYTRAIVLGAPGMLLVYAANGIFRGLQKVRITLIAAVSGAVMNAVLDVLFVIVLHWGIAGSGIATLIAQWYMGLFLVAPAILWARADGASLRPRIAGIAAAGGDGLPLVHPHAGDSRGDGGYRRLRGAHGYLCARWFSSGELLLEFRDEHAGFSGYCRANACGHRIGCGQCKPSPSIDPSNRACRTGDRRNHRCGLCNSRTICRTPVLPHAACSDTDCRWHGDYGRVLPLTRLDDGD